MCSHIFLSLPQRQGMIRIGLLGAGHLGKIHLKLLLEIPEYEVSGFYDPDDAQAKLVEDAFHVKRYASMQQLILASDAVDIVTPTLSHYDCAKKAIKQSKHIFIEKPLANTVREAKDILNLVHEAGIKAQVGHVERFNPAFLALKNHVLSPMFIETHRLSHFNPRGTDVSVVLDLMIHDIDIILHLVQSGVKKISASGVAVISNKPDIANARIEFSNGCVANLTASRISMKQMRKMRLFQKDAYYSIDFGEKMTEILSFANTDDNTDALSIEVNTGNKFEKKTIKMEIPEIKQVNSIKMELELFARAILDDTETAVPVSDGLNALQVAHMILHKIEKNTSFHS